MPIPFFQTRSGHPAPWRCHKVHFNPSEPRTSRKVVGLTRSRNVDGKLEVGLWAVDRLGLGEAVSLGKRSSGDGTHESGSVPGLRSRSHGVIDSRSVDVGDTGVGSHTVSGDSGVGGRGGGNYRNSCGNKALRFVTGSVGTSTAGNRSTGGNRRKKKKCVVM
ncbi:hypothetical protein B7463_g6735, partial [Scytalidium lignicola]